MKSLFVAFILLTFCFLNNIYSQKIVISASMFSEPKYSLDGGINYKNVEKNIKELKSLMKNCNDCLDALDNYETKSSTSEVISFIGGACIGWPLGGYLARSKWEDYYTPMMLVGGCAIVVGILVVSSAISNLEDAAELYNRTITQNGIDFFPRHTSCNSIPNNGKIISVSISF